MVFWKCIGAIALALAAQLASAQVYPSKAVRMVNPFPPGGPLDLLGRLLSDRLAAALGKPVIVENKSGAAGNVGAAEVAKAPADGHTVLLTLFSIVTSNPHLYERMPFDPLKDFAAITALAGGDSGADRVLQCRHRIRPAHLYRQRDRRHQFAGGPVDRRPPQ